MIYIGSCVLCGSAAITRDDVLGTLEEPFKEKTHARANRA